MPTASEKALNNPLKRELSLVDVFTISTGSMISSGLFIIPGLAFARVGPAVVASYLLAALIALPTMLSASELATAMPKAGGVYYFVSRSMGFDLGAIAGFARWLSISLKSAFSLIGIGVYSALFTGVDPLYISVALGILFMVINLVGIKLVGRTQTLLTIALASLLIYIVSQGLTSLSIERFTPFAPFGLSPVLSTAGFIFISYGGMLTITGLAEEVKRPQRNIPLGMLLSLAFTGIIYTLVILVIIGVLDPELLRGTLTPVSDGARIYLGQAGVIMTTAAALLAFVTTANAGIASASRYPLAMSRDRILPVLFQNTYPKSGIPYLSVLSTGGFILAAIALLKLEILVEVASSLLIITYILTNTAVILLRRKKSDTYRPVFHTPLFPWLQLFSIGGLIVLLVKISVTSLLFSLLFIGAAFAWHRFYSHYSTVKADS